MTDGATGWVVTVFIVAMAIISVVAIAQVGATAKHCKPHGSAPYVGAVND